MKGLASPGHALLLCQLLQADQHENEIALSLIRQVRAVTVLSMAVKYELNEEITISSRLTISNVTDNTVQYYLAYLNIPVEYIRFDNEHLSTLIGVLIHSSVDLDNWRNLQEISLHPHSNYISLLSIYLPVSLFYTIFVQIIVNKLNRLDASDFSYILRVLGLLPSSRRYAFARFCWRMSLCHGSLINSVASYALEAISSETHLVTELSTFIQFATNTQK